MTPPTPPPDVNAILARFAPIREALAEALNECQKFGPMPDSTPGWYLTDASRASQIQDGLYTIIWLVQPPDPTEPGA